MWVIQARLMYEIGLFEYEEKLMELQALSEFRLKENHITAGRNNFLDSMPR
jgi:hypothetical protein